MFRDRADDFGKGDPFLQFFRQHVTAGIGRRLEADAGDRRPLQAEFHDLAEFHAVVLSHIGADEVLAQSVGRAPLAEVNPDVPFKVTDNLVIELVPQATISDPNQQPILNAIEIFRRESKPMNPL
ncbi:MAG: hypothetical protein IH899_17045, partial [Planctomycetes bacterium]|nr:hypothetical protein [Planctomycetota bacterium]